MTDRRRQLARIGRVRTVQLNLARAAAADAHAFVASETALERRIALLAAEVAPSMTAGAGMSLAAAALYRERLQHSAQAAGIRVARAEQQASDAGDAARAAERDSKAVDKLRQRAEADAALATLRALEDMPAIGRSERHATC